MEWTFSNSVSLYIITIFVPIITFLLLHLWPKHNSGGIPGPKGWPVFGYLFSLGSMPHRSLAELKQKYGGVIFIKLCTKNTVIIQNSKAATEFFRKHDLEFADRSVTDMMQSHDYCTVSMGLSPYGPHWKALRRILTLGLIVNKQLNELSAVREKCVGDMLSWIDKKAEDSDNAQRCGIPVMEYAMMTAFNMMGNHLFSRDIVNPDQSYDQMASELYSNTVEVMHLSGVPNISDLFPRLKRFDLQHLRRKMDHYLAKVMEIFSSYIEERIEERKEPARGREKRKDLLDALLDYEGTGPDEPAKISKHNICTFMLDAVLGITETTSSTVEWGMTELLRTPEAMIKLKAELIKALGPNKRLEERDIDSLPYLQAVVKETLRLHPPIPLLVPRRCIPEKTNFMGYNIQRNTQVFVNVWAIGRDPEFWDEALSFKPERFLSSDGSLKNDEQHFEMLPFGGGRRLCPGMPLGKRTVPLVLGSMIHEFDWEPENISAEAIDMRDKMGMIVTKLEPLKAIPKRIVCFQVYENQS